jgi:hypothetical protein
MAAPAPTLELRRGLAGLRRRIRGLFALTGVSRVVVALVLALGLFYAADLFLDLPLGVRRFVRLGLLDQPTWLPGWLWLPCVVAAGLLALLLVRGRRAGAPLAAFLFAGLGGLLAALALRAFAPLTARLRDEELAAAVEARNQKLGDRLESALDFEREMARDAQGQGRGESRAMMQTLLDQARVDARGVAFARVASGRTTVAWLGSAALALIAAGAFFALSPAKVGLFARRSLLLEDVPWPRASTLYAARVAEDGSVTPWPPETPFEVAVGRSLVVHAWVQGEPVDDAVLLDVAPGQQPLPRRMFPVAGRPGLYAVELVNVRQGFGFIVQGGDDRDDVPLYRVEATVPPALIEVSADLEFPAYLTRPATRVEGGGFEVPEGTRIALTLVPSEPLESLRAQLGDEMRTAERTSVDGGGEAWRLTFEAQRSIRYRLLLRTPKGRENDPGQDAYEIVVKPDAAPRIAWTWPRGVTAVTPTGRVPLLLDSTDDHAITEQWLDLRVGSDGPITEVRLAPYVPGEPSGIVGTAGALTAAANDGPLGRTRVATYLPLDLAWFASQGVTLPMPSTITVRLRARDSKGQTGESSWQSLEVSAPAEVERTLATRRSGVRSAVDSLEVEQAARLKQVQELRKGPLEAGERDVLKTVEFAQAKLGQHGERAVRDYLDVFVQFVLDRLGAENPNERILAMLDRHHRASYGRPPTGALAAPGALSGEDPVFPYALFEEVVAAWRSRTILDTALLERMLAVLDVALELATRHGPAAHHAATRASSGGAAELEALEVAQQAQLDALRRLIESLASWESLNDVIVRLKRIIEEQKALWERLRADDSARKDDGAPAPGGR